MDKYLRKITANLELMWRLIQPLPTGKSSRLMRISVFPNSCLISRILRCWENIFITWLRHFQWEERHGEFINIYLCVCPRVWYNTCLIFFSRLLTLHRKRFSTLDDKWISIFLHLADNERLLPDERIYTRGHFRVLDPCGSNHITEKCMWTYCLVIIYMYSFLKLLYTNWWDKTIYRLWYSFTPLI